MTGGITRASALQRKAIGDFQRRFGAVQLQSVPLGYFSAAQVAELLYAAEENVLSLSESLWAIADAGHSGDEVTRMVRAHLADIEQNVLSGWGVAPSASTADALQKGITRIRGRLPNSARTDQTVPKAAKNKGGHPGKWNWEGALIYLIALANQPDGLPEGRGAQTRIVELIADWFAATSNDGDTPAPSEIKKRARSIMEELSR